MPRTLEIAMSKHQRGNKEAKKPKKVAPAVKPLLPGEALPALGPAAAERPKRK